MCSITSRARTLIRRIYKRSSELPAFAPRLARALVATTLLVAACGDKQENQPRKANETVAQPATPTTTPARPITGGNRNQARSCASKVDCSADENCYFGAAGCNARGFCLASNVVSPHNCNQNVPVCLCGSRTTMYSPGGCAGDGVTEPWTLYACACSSDADCRGTQRCVATHSARTDSTMECR
jgi:hypothetical protein